MAQRSVSHTPVSVAIAKYRLMMYVREHYADEVTAAGDFIIPRELLILPRPGTPSVISMSRGEFIAP